MTKVKLSYEEYRKACDAGLYSGSACCCTGAIDGDEYCPCSMSVLDKLTEEGQATCKEKWRERGYLPRSEIEAAIEEAHKDPIERNPLRKKRMELMAQKYPNIKGQSFE